MHLVTGADAVSVAFFTCLWARVFPLPRHSEKGTHMELTYENVSQVV